MKNRASFIAMYLCLLLLFTCGVGELALADRGERISKTENRVLQPFPAFSVKTVFSGEFMDDFEAFLSDGFFFRDSAADFSESVMGIFSLPEKGHKTGAIDESRLFETQEGDEEQLELIMQSEVTDEAEQIPGESMESDGAGDSALPDEISDAELWIVNPLGDRRNLETYYARNLQILARILNEYRAELPEDGTVNFINPPVADVANNVLRGEYIDWGTSVDDVLQPLVDEGVYIYDATDILRPYIGQLNLYPTIDHHWHPVSASIVANAMLERQGLLPNDYNEYRYYVANISQGGPFDTETLDSMNLSIEDVPVMAPVSPVESYVVTHLNEKSESVFIDRYSGGYRQYLGGTKRPWRLFVTGYHTGRNALVIGDSFTNCFIPYLTPYYDNVVSTDFRDGGYSLADAGANARQYIEEYHIDDIYIVTCTYTSINGETVLDRMERYLYLDYDKLYGG